MDLLRSAKKCLKQERGNQGDPARGGRANAGEKAMKDVLVAAALFFFATIMLLFPSAWEPVSDGEARKIFGE